MTDDDLRPDLGPVRGLGQLFGELRRLLRHGPGGHLRRARDAASSAAMGDELRVAVELARLFLWPSSARRRTAYGYRRYARRVLEQAGLPKRGPLQRRVTAHQVRIAAHNVTTLRQGLVGGVLLALSVAAAGLSKLSQGATPGTTTRPVGPLPYRWAAIATVVLVVAVVARLVLGPKSGRAAALPLAVAALAACGLFLWAAALHGSVLLVVVTASAAVTLVPSLCLLLAFHVLAGGFLDWRERTLAAAEPDAMATDAILRLLDRSCSGWRRSATRAAMLADLERLARAVDGGFARLMRSGDRPTDAWVRERATEAGAAVRRLKRWVATPLADTRARLRERLAADLALLAEGRWDELERATPGPEDLVRPPRWATIWSIATTVGVAFAPGAALWAYRRLDPADASALPAWAAGGCALWAVTVLALAADPALPDRTRSVRGVLDTLAGRGKA